MAQSKKPRRTFTPEFKHQLVQLYKNGKRKSDITKEYDVGYSTLERWLEQEANSGSFKEKDNLTPEQLERGNEFKNQLIDETLSTFNIDRSGVRQYSFYITTRKFVCLILQAFHNASTQKSLSTLLTTELLYLYSDWTFTC